MHMLISKDELADRIRKICLKNINKPKLISAQMKQLYSQYKIPIDTAQEILMLKGDISAHSDFTLFCVYNILNGKDIESIFTKEEIEAYSNAEHKQTVIQFPLKFKMVQVADDQWIGSISVKQLIQLRDAQLIRYNENIQRNLQHVVRGNVEYYRIFLNQRAVSAIQESMMTDMFIPNTLTFNLPEDADVSYDGNYLIIKSLDQFDILDGYHRYIAISKIVNTNADFDYNMELRIVKFPEAKAKQFIWQEDQKTKMRKADSNSFNQTLDANRIVEQIKSDPNFVLFGKISRNMCVINSTELSTLIHVIWFASHKDNKETAILKSKWIREKFKEVITEMIEQDPSLVNSRWSYPFLCCVMACMYGKVDTENVLDTAKRLYEKYDDHITLSNTNKRTITRLVKIIQGGV